MLSVYSVAESYKKLTWFSIVRDNTNEVSVFCTNCLENPRDARINSYYIFIKYILLENTKKSINNTEDFIICKFIVVIK